MKHCTRSEKGQHSRTLAYRKCGQAQSTACSRILTSQQLIKYPHRGCFKVPIHNSTQSNSVPRKCDVPVGCLETLLKQRFDSVGGAGGCFPNAAHVTLVLGPHFEQPGLRLGAAHTSSHFVFPNSPMRQVLFLSSVLQTRKWKFRETPISQLRSSRNGIQNQLWPTWSPTCVLPT